MAITTEQVKQLREETGVSVMQCKKALEEAGGDPEKARVILSKISKQQADKKSARSLGSGTIGAYVHGETGRVGAMVVLSCETDFVAKNEEFQSVARDIAMHIAAMAPKYLRREDIPEEDMQKAREVFMEEVKDKPEDKQEMILKGKLDAYFGELILLEQKFIKDPTKTILNLCEEAVQKFDENTTVTEFARFSV